jgi:hypothetical protein
MNYLLENASDSDKEKWNEYVFGSAVRVTPYHLYSWRDTLKRAYGVEGDYIFAKEEESGRIAGIMPVCFMRGAVRAGISLPFCTHAGIAADNAEVEALLKDKASDLCLSRGISYVELRQASYGEDPESAFFVTQIADLESTKEAQWERLPPACRRAVRSARKKGVRFKRGKEELLGDFYDIYSANMKRLGTPAHPRKLFLNCLENLKVASVLLACYENKPLAGMIVMKCRRTAHDPWVSSYYKYNNFFPNDFLYWYALCWGIENGCSEFDFGRSTRYSGVHRFKGKWASREVPLKYVRLSGGGEKHLRARGNPAIRKSFAFLWSALPGGITDRFNSAVRKYVP